VPPGTLPGNLHRHAAPASRGHPARQTPHTRGVRQRSGTCVGRQAPTCWAVVCSLPGSDAVRRCVAGIPRSSRGQALPAIRGRPRRGPGPQGRCAAGLRVGLDTSFLYPYGHTSNELRLEHAPGPRSRTVTRFLSRAPEIGALTFLRPLPAKTCAPRHASDARLFPGLILGAGAGIVYLPAARRAGAATEAGRAGYART
jgi:hypothetical protein